MLARMVSNSWPHDPPTSTSQSAGVRGVSHRAWPLCSFFNWAVCFFLQLSCRNSLCISGFCLFNAGSCVKDPAIFSQDGLYPQIISLIRAKVFQGSLFMSWTVFPSNLYMKVLIPSTSKYDYIWREAFQRENQRKVRSSEWILIPHNWCPHKNRRWGHLYT